MTLAQFEREIMKELRIVAKDDKLKLKELMEWACGKDVVKAEEGETLYYLPKLNVSVSIKKTK